MRACARAEALASARQSAADATRVQNQVEWMQRIIDRSDNASLQREEIECRDNKEREREDRRGRMAEVLQADAEECYQRLAEQEASRLGFQPHRHDSVAIRKGEVEPRQNHSQMKEADGSAKCESHACVQKSGEGFSNPVPSHALDPLVTPACPTPSCINGKDAPKQDNPSGLEESDKHGQGRLQSLRCYWKDAMDDKKAIKEQEHMEKMLLRKAAEQQAEAFREERRLELFKKRAQQKLMKEAYDAQVAEKARARRSELFHMQA